LSAAQAGEKGQQMCGRFVLAASKNALGALFKIIVDGPYEPRYNIAPTQPVLHIHQFSGAVRVDFARWGLIPSWHKDPENAQLLINARSETVLEKPSFKNAIRHRRVLVPATHFYEWRREGKAKQPYAVARTRPDGEEGLFAMAGIVDEWAGKNGEVLSTLAILTQEAIGDIADIHHRMPMVVPPEHYASWLDCRAVDAQMALEPLRVTQPDAWRLWPVDRVVNRAGVDGAMLLDEIALEEPEPSKPDAQMSLF
jgi:putative SOS response-associated peptidase YedK